jgi:hypothetical protein
MTTPTLIPITTPELLKMAYTQSQKDDPDSFFALPLNLQIAVLAATLEFHEDKDCGDWDVGVAEQLLLLTDSIRKTYLPEDDE